jgi:hypothetical protein
LIDWYKHHQTETSRMVAPSDADRLAAVDLDRRYLEDDLSRAVDEYWRRWPSYWFAVRKGDARKPPTQRKAVHLFASFARNIEELLQGQPAEQAEVESIEF